MLHGKIRGKNLLPSYCSKHSGHSINRSMKVKSMIRFDDDEHDAPVKICGIFPLNSKSKNVQNLFFLTTNGRVILCIICIAKNIYIPTI